MVVRIGTQSITPARLVHSFAWMLMAFYVGYHALHGDRGLYALFREQRELAVLKEELKVTRAEREKMEQKVTHLRDASLDRDLLDEQARRMLGVMRKGEVMVFTSDADASSTP